MVEALQRRIRQAYLHFPSIVKTNRVSRRRFIQSTTGVATLTVLPNGLRAANQTSRLKVAGIGLGGRIQGLLSGVVKLGHDVVALCDVDEAQIVGTRNRHKENVAKAKSYQDYRVLFEKEQDLDAVIISTPDHWHAPICRAAMAAGKHVYCEKPLTHTIAEARELRELSRSSQVITQMGNQGSASSNLRRSMELIDAGIFGDITEVHVWHPKHGWPNGVDRPADSDHIPQGLDWDFWLGPAPVRPYKEAIYHPGKWRGWYDFGNGSLGDFCCHSFNLPLRALKLSYPNKIDFSGKGLGKESYATSCTVSFHFPAVGDRGPVKLHYYTGGDLPPQRIIDSMSGTFGKLGRVGCVLEGTQGELSAGLWNSQCYVKLKGEAKFLGADKHEAAKAVAQSIPRVKGHLDEWLDVCQGGPKVFADFDFGGHLTEIGLAGNVATRLQQSIAWDGPNMKVPGLPEADPYIRKADRQKWL